MRVAKCSLQFPVRLQAFLSSASLHLIPLISFQVAFQDCDIPISQLPTNL